jgi:glycosyltransferase involved in cell wall biosynthesis
MNKVSIILPCYNASGTLGEAIESACAQLEVDREILVIDDGSTDESFAIAKMFSPVVRVLSGPNRGVSLARNLGIAETSGDWIVFLDADDLLLPGTLEKRLRTASLTDCDVILCDYWNLLQTEHGMVDGKVNRIDITLLENNGEIACVDDVSVTTAALMYHRRIVEKIGGFRKDLPIIQDQRFLFDAAYNGARFAYSAHIGARYRVAPSSLSHRNPELVCLDMLENTQQIEALWRSRGQLSAKQRDALAGAYNYAARGLFAVGHLDYFRAVKYLRRTVDRLPLRARIAAPLGAAVGLRAARQILNHIPSRRTILQALSLGWIRVPEA